MRPDLSKTVMCQFWAKGGCIKGARCSYAHGDDELRSADEVPLVDGGEVARENGSALHDSIRKLASTYGARAPHKRKGQVKEFSKSGDHCPRCLVPGSGVQARFCVKCGGALSPRTWDRRNQEQPDAVDQRQGRTCGWAEQASPDVSMNDPPRMIWQATPGGMMTFQAPGFAVQSNLPDGSFIMPVVMAVVYGVDGSVMKLVNTTKPCRQALSNINANIMCGVGQQRVFED